MKSFFRDGLFIAQAKLLRIPVLVFFRAWNESFAETSERKFGWFFNISYAKADMFVVLASKFKEDLRRRGIEAPVLLTHTIVEDELLTGFQIDQKKWRADGTVRLLFMARIIEKKGIFELIAAVRKLLALNYPIELTIAGDGDAMPAVQKIVQDFGDNESSITVTGFLRNNEKKAALMNHDIFCLPSEYYEGMPNAVLEAMAFGMPVITTRMGGIPDFFIDGKMGALLNSKHVDEIVSAVRKLLENEENLAEMGRFNHDYAMQRFLASHAAEFLFTTYGHMLSEMHNGSH